MCGNTFLIGSQPEESHKDPGSEDESVRVTTVKENRPT